MASVPSWTKKVQRKKSEPTEKSGTTLAKIIFRKPDGSLTTENIVSCNRLQHRTYAKDKSVVMLTPVYATDPQFNRNYNRMGWDFRTPVEKAMIEVTS